MIRSFKQKPFARPTPQAVLVDTATDAKMSISGAETRLAEVVQHITEISSQIERKRRPGEARSEWRKSAMKARDELREEEKSLKGFIENSRHEIAVSEKKRRSIEETARQDADRSTRDARKIAKREGLVVLWDVYMKAEVALLSIVAGGGQVGILGDTLLRTSHVTVPEWYRDQWLRSVYGTTWGKHASALKGNQ